MQSYLLNLNGSTFAVSALLSLGVVFGAAVLLFRTERRRRLDLKAELDAAKFREQSRLQAATDREQTVRSLAVATLARQIAHDIRSPMTALKMAAASKDGVNEDIRNLLIASGSRLGQIADSLLKMKLRNPTESGTAVDVQIATVIREVVIEKRQQYVAWVNVHLDLDVDENLFIRIDPIEFKRVLSNLIHNAYAAVTGSGRIKIQLIPEEESAVIHIHDTGHGMDDRLLHVIRRRSDLLKDGQPQPGFGLGIPHAQVVIEAARGSLEYSNASNGGAIVSIRVPAIPPPVWYVPILRIQSGQIVIVVDDDPSMHEVWQTKLKAVGAQTAFFLSTEAVQLCLQDLEPNSYIFLIDYDLGVGQPTGLEFICLNNLETASVLVTGQAEELHDRCNELRLRLLSKSSLPNLKVEALIS